MNSLIPCHVGGCDRQIHSDTIMCAEHWKQVPWRLRERIRLANEAHDPVLLDLAYKSIAHVMRWEAPLIDG